MKKNEKKENKNTIPIVGAIIVIISALLVVFFLRNKDDIYKFDFFDGYDPGATYKGEINLTNGKVDYKIIHGCTLPNQEECPNDTLVKGTLNESQLELVKTTLEKINRENNAWLLSGVSYLIDGDKICDELVNKTCSEIGELMIVSIK